MQAMDIANDALDSVLGNFKAALKITLPVLLLNFGLIALMSYDFWQAALSGNRFGAEAILKDPYGTTRVVFVPLLMVGISLYWVTVAWHRFVILDEQPNGILPKLHLGRIWAYIWRLLVLAILAGLVVGLPLGVLSNAFGVGGRINFTDYSAALQNGPFAVALHILGTTLFSYLFMRYSPVLVGAAIGRPITVGTAQASTFAVRKDIFILAIGYAAVALIHSMIGGGLQFGFWPIDLCIALALQWVTFMFSISLLTTLYQKSVAYYADDRQVDRIKD